MEASTAVVEEIFEGGTEEVEDHDVVVAFDSIPADIGDADCKFILLFQEKNERGVMGEKFIH